MSDQFPSYVHNDIASKVTSGGPKEKEPRFIAPGATKTEREEVDKTEKKPTPASE